MPVLTIPKNRRRRAAVLVVGIAALLAVLAGVGLAVRILRPAWQTTVPAPQETIATIQSATAEPTQLSIPSLNINASFVRLGLNRDQTLEVPKGHIEVGWFIYGAKPGDPGPAVVVGHLDSDKGPAVFANLRTIKKGELVAITRTDGSTVSYRVDSISQYSQDNFPTQAVYGPLDYAGLRLITCAGTYSRQKDRYSDNLIVFGTMVK